MVILNDQFSIKNLIVSPSRLRMTLGSDEHQEIDIRMLNTLGATVQQSKKTLNPGFTDIDLSIQALAPGVYWFEVRGNNIRHVSEFLKK